METNLQQIFFRIKDLMKRYEPPFTPKMNYDSKYDLWSFKKMEAYGRKRKEMYFAGLIIQSSYVGFYYMPVYGEEKLKEVFHPDFLKLLKGKSCFHIKKLDDQTLQWIDEALEIGFKLYQERGWV